MNISPKSLYLCLNSGPVVMAVQRRQLLARDTQIVHSCFFIIQIHSYLLEKHSVLFYEYMNFVDLLRSIV